MDLQIGDGPWQWTSNGFFKPCIPVTLDRPAGSQKPKGACTPRWFHRSREREKCRILGISGISGISEHVYMTLYKMYKYMYIYIYLFIGQDTLRSSEWVLLLLFTHPRSQRRRFLHKEHLLQKHLKAAQSETKKHKNPSVHWLNAPSRHRVRSQRRTVQPFAPRWHPFGGPPRWLPRQRHLHGGCF